MTEKDLGAIVETTPEEDMMWWNANMAELVKTYGCVHAIIQYKTVLGTGVTPQDAIAKAEKHPIFQKERYFLVPLADPDDVCPVFEYKY
jgi:hypothetical protein